MWGRNNAILVNHFLIFIFLSFKQSLFYFCDCHQSHLCIVALVVIPANARIHVLVTDTI